MEHIEEVVLDPKKPNQKVRIRTKLRRKMKNNLLIFLWEQKKCFAWDASDMLGINPKLITHKLNANLSIKPIKQNKRKFAHEIN